MIDTLSEREEKLSKKSRYISIMGRYPLKNATYFFFNLLGKMSTFGKTVKFLCAMSIMIDFC